MLAGDKIQSARELMHVIKRLHIYLTRHKSGNNKADHVVGNLLCKV